MFRKKNLRSKPASEIDTVAKLTMVTKSYTITKKKIVILDQLNITFKESKVYVIIGASGSGKSTLLNIIGGLDTCSHGEVELCGMNITRASESQLALLRARKVGFIFQQHCLINELSLLENILLPSYIYKFTRNGALSHAQDLLQAIGLEDRQDHLVGELSGGEMQRAAIARALINRPKVVLADEPTGDLDRHNSLDAFSLLQSLAKESKSAIIMVTHDLSLAEKADIVLRIKDCQLKRVNVNTV